jgi:hypothetical protein
MNITPYSNIFKKIIFVNDSIGYACGSGGIAFFCKTTNRGNNWTKTSYPSATGFRGISILGKDTIYVVDDDGLVGGVFRSTNGGQNWLRIYSASQYNPREIYMINANTGFSTDDASNFYKTINGGYSWVFIDKLSFYDIHFIDTLIGYRANGGILETTNGGNNWKSQTIPNVPGISTYKNIQRLFFIGRDTMWAVGSSVWYPNPGRYRGLINKTTNGGLNWGYQIPDTHFVILGFSFINFSNDKIGWSYYENGKGIHTTTGGDSTLFVGIYQNNGNMPGDFLLEQNYPNPFNAETKIRYNIPNRSPIGTFGDDRVVLKVYDIRGKEIAVLVNQKQNAGTYEVTFDGSNFPSGIYFYQLRVGTYSETKKMILLKKFERY